MTTAQEKLVVRVSLSATTGASDDLPEPVTEQRWHWRRIAGALLTLAAALFLLFSWLNVDLPETENDLVFETELLITATTARSELAPSELGFVSKRSEAAIAETAVVSTATYGAATTTATDEAETDIGEDEPADDDVALLQPEDGTPLFKADSGVLRLAILTNEAPSAKAISYGDKVDAATVSQLALYSEVKGLNGQSIEHLWYFEGKLMTRIKLPVKLDYWRTYSRKEFDSGQTGEWRVEILDPQQNLLFSHHFHYQ